MGNESSRSKLVALNDDWGIDTSVDAGFFDTNKPKTQAVKMLFPPSQENKQAAPTVSAKRRAARKQLEQDTGLPPTGGAGAESRRLWGGPGGQSNKPNKKPNAIEDSIDQLLRGDTMLNFEGAFGRKPAGGIGAGNDTDRSDKSHANIFDEPSEDLGKSILSGTTRTRSRAGAGGLVSVVAPTGAITGRRPSVKPVLAGRGKNTMAALIGDSSGDEGNTFHGQQATKGKQSIFDKDDDWLTGDTTGAYTMSNPSAGRKPFGITPSGGFGDSGSTFGTSKAPPSAKQFYMSTSRYAPGVNPSKNTKLNNQKQLPPIQGWCLYFIFFIFPSLRAKVSR